MVCGCFRTGYGLEDAQSAQERLPLQHSEAQQLSVAQRVHQTVVRGSAALFSWGVVESVGLSFCFQATFFMPNLSSSAQEGLVGVGSFLCLISLMGATMSRQTIAARLANLLPANQEVERRVEHILGCFGTSNFFAGMLGAYTFSLIAGLFHKEVIEASGVVQMTLITVSIACLGITCLLPIQSVYRVQEALGEEE